MSSAIALREIEEKSKALFKLYNPSLKQESFSYGGNPYPLPPRSAVPIGNRMGVSKEGASIVVHNAIDIVRHALKENVLGMKGITALFDDGKDQERVAAANKAYMEWRHKDANAQYAAHMKKSKAYAENNPGARPMLPDRSTQDAIEFLQEYKRGAFEVRKEHACKAQYCGMEYDTAQELADHVALLHLDGQLDGREVSVAPVVPVTSSYTKPTEDDDPFAR